MDIILENTVIPVDNLVKHKYGSFKSEQVEYYKKKLRKKIFWLILYTDSNTNEDFKDVNVVKYHENLLLELSSLNRLLLYPKNYVEVINTLEEALEILKSDAFDFTHYKKLVFNAGDLMEQVKVGDNNVSL